MAEDFERVVLVTGAASGIGAATARRLAGRGTALLLHTRRNRESLETVAGEARAAGAAVETALGDLASPEVPAALVDAARQRFGRLDQIVSNAGSGDRRRFGALEVEDLRASFAVIAEGFFGLATAALPDLERSAWGRVVAVSSFVAHNIGVNGTIFPASAAAKAGMEALARTLALQLAPTGTTVNCVVPGYTRKDPGAHHAIPEDAWQAAAQAAPMRKLARPEDIAAAIAFLLSREAGHITGQALHIDGGLSLL